jgi:hypothetical protein
MSVARRSETPRRVCVAPFGAEVPIDICAHRNPAIMQRSHCPKHQADGRKVRRADTPPRASQLRQSAAVSSTGAGRTEGPVTGFLTFSCIGPHSDIPMHWRRIWYFWLLGRCQACPRHRAGQKGAANSQDSRRYLTKGGIWFASARPDATWANVGKTRANRASVRGATVGAPARGRVCSGVV